MIRLNSSRLPVAVMLSAAVVLAVGGAAVASNMGFKMNKPLVGNTATSGQNWVSFPYNNPYGTIKNMCTQTGLPSALASTAQVTVINPANNVATTATCFAATTQPLPTNCTGVRILVPNGTVTNMIIVGSHDPAKSCSIPANSASSGQFWFNVPYHTTALTAKDLCNQIGLASTLASTGQLTRINATNNLADTRTCFSGTSTGLNLVLGESIRIINPSAVNFVPAHY